MSSEVNNQNNTGKKQQESSSIHEDVFGAIKNGKIQTQEILIQENNNTFQVHTRVYLMRHLPYKDTDAYNEYNEIRKELKSGNESRLKRFGELDDILEADESKADTALFDQIFLDPQNIVFIHNDYESSKQRIKQTIDFVKNEKRYQGYTEEEFSIVGSKKGGDKMKALLDAGHEINEILIYIKENIKQYEGKTIVILGSRSHSHFLDKEKFDEKGKNQTEKEFEGRGYDMVDLNEMGIYPQRKDSIIVTPENYTRLKKIFGTISHISLLDFQNKLNEKFAKNKYKYEDYIFSESEDVRVFCVLKLIQIGNIKILNQFFQKYKIDISRFGKISEKENAILVYYYEVYSQVVKTRERSLDNRIQRGEDIEPYFNFDNEKYSEVLSLVTQGKPIKYIEGKPGAGKSYLLSYIAEKLNEENITNTNLQKTYYPIYISLSGKGIDEIKEVSNGIYNNYQVVYLIDSIDESHISGEERKKLDEKILNLSKNGKVIITSRKGYQTNYDNEKEDDKKQKENIYYTQENINIEDFSFQHIQVYLIKSFGENNKNIELSKKILERLNGAGNNPLILCMICEIVKDGKINNKDIEKLSIIDIYDYIVELRLLEYNNKKGVKIGNKKFYELVLSGLQEIGYKQLITGEKIQNISEYIPTPNDELSNSINLLFRKNEEIKGYDFVHESFTEYFAAQYIFEEMRNNPEFDYEDFLCQKLKKVDINFVKIFLEYIKNDENLQDKILKAIDENESYFVPIIHNKIIHILGYFDEKRKNEYGKYIKILKNTSSHEGKEEDNTHGESDLTQEGTQIKTENIDLLQELADNEGYREREAIIKRVLQKKSQEDLLVLKGALYDYERTYLLEVLAGLGGEENIQLIKKYIYNEENYIRIKVIEVLAGLGGEENAEFIRRQISDTDEEVRKQVVESLMTIGGEKNIAFLKEQIYSKDSFIRVRILELLRSLGGEENISLIKKQINDSDSYVRYMVIKILANIGGKENIEFIASHIHNNDTETKIEMMQMLSKIGGEAIFSLIRLFAYDADMEVRIEAIKMLSDGDQLSLVRESLMHENPVVRMKSLEILGEWGGKENILLIRNRIKNEQNITILKRSIQILGEIGGKENIVFLKSIIADPDRDIRQSIVKVIGVLAPNHIDFIQNLIQDEDEDIRWDILNILGETLSIENYVELLRKCIDDPSAQIRNKVYWDLRQYGTNEDKNIAKKYIANESGFLSNHISNILKKAVKF